MCRHANKVTVEHFVNFATADRREFAGCPPLLRGACCFAHSGIWVRQPYLLALRLAVKLGLAIPAATFPLVFVTVGCTAPGHAWQPGHASSVIPVWFFVGPAHPRCWARTQRFWPTATTASCAPPKPTGTPPAPPAGHVGHCRPPHHRRVLLCGLEHGKFSGPC